MLAASVTLGLSSTQAAVFTYTPTGTTTNWADTTGSGWSSTPVSAPDTELTFVSPNTTVLTASTSVSNNNITGTGANGGFQLNILDLQGTGPASGAALINTTGNPLEFGLNGATTPVVNLNALKGAGTGLTYTVSNNVILDAATTFTGNGTGAFVFSGAFSGASAITKTGTSVLDVSGVNNGFTGDVNLNGGTMRFASTNSSALAWVTTGTLNLGAAGTLSTTAGNGAFGAITGTGALNFAGQRTIAINYNGGTADVFSGTVLGMTALTKDGAGTLTLANTSGAATTVTASGTVLSNWGTLNLAADSGLGSINVFGGQVNLTATSGVVNGQGTSLLSGGVLHIAPAGSGAAVAVSGATTAQVTNSVVQLRVGGTVLLDRGSNTSLTYTIGNTGNTLGPIIRRDPSSSFVVGVSTGLSELGTTVRFVTLGAAGTVSLPTNVNGILNPSFVGQDNDAGKSGDFLKYVGTGAATDAGFESATIANAYTDTNFSTATTTTTVEKVTTNVSTAGQTVFALRNDAVITNSGTLTIGDNTAASTGTSNAVPNGTTGQAGVILNGGAINGGTLAFGASEGAIYVSGANGAIGSNITGTGGLTVFGPGVLVASGTLTSLTGAVAIDDGSTLQTASATSFPGDLTLRGGVFQTSGSFVRALGTGNGQVNMNNSQGGGFAAKGGALTVNLGGSATPTQVVWNNGATGTTAFLPDGATLKFGSSTSDSLVDFRNPVDLGANTYNFTRVINVAAGLTGSVAQMSGIISSTSANNGIAKDGAGILSLTGNNTYAGGTAVSAGTLSINNVTVSGVGSGAGTGAVTVNAGATLGGGNGAANTGTTVTLGTGANASASAVYQSGILGVVSGTVNNSGTLAPGRNVGAQTVGTLTLGALTLNTGSTLLYEFNSSANDFVAVTGALTLSGAINLTLVQEGTANPLMMGGIYNLISYGSNSSINTTGLAVANPVAGYSYTFVNDTMDGLLQLNVIAAVPEPGAWAYVLGCGLLLLVYRARRRPSRGRGQVCS